MSAKPQWYVLKAIPGRESKAKESILNNLRQEGLMESIEELLIPVERVTEVKRGKKVTSERKLYPGYIYVHMVPNYDALEIITNVDGVTGFLGAEPGDPLPTPLTQEEADRIIQIANAPTDEEQRAAIIQIPFNVGDKVKVREGTFAGMDGQVDEINQQKGTLKVLITVFGRQTPIELEVWQVEDLA